MIGRGRQHFRRIADGDVWPERRIGKSSTSLASAGSFNLSIATAADARTRTIVFWSVAIAVVAAISGGFALLPAHAVDPDARGALQVTIAVSAIVTSWLLIANWRHGRELPDLLLLAGLLALSLADFVSLGMPALKEMSRTESSNAMRLGGELVAALAIAAAAIAGLKSARESRRELVGFELGAGAGLVVLGLLLAILLGTGALHTATEGQPPTEPH